MAKNLKDLSNLSTEMRKTILELSFNCGHAAHIGGGMSIVDILATLYDGVGGFDVSGEKNRFILSKGHGFLGLLAILYYKGFIKKDELFKFQKNGSEFIAHPIANPKIGIESSKSINIFSAPLIKAFSTKSSLLPGTYR